MIPVRQTKLIVNTKHIEHNIKQIQDFVGKEVTVMPVIKSSGYGTGIDTRTDIFTKLNIKILCVAVVDEGIALRERGYDGEILILNQPLEEEITTALQYDLILSVCISDFILSLNKLAKQKKQMAKIHLEINTGMNRTGINPKDIYNYINLIKELDYIELDGIYSHLSSSDTNVNYTKEQIRIFDNIANIVKKEFNLKYIHICNTGGILNFKEAHYNSVRPGISIYGHFPNDNLKNKINLIPATILKTKISYIHEVIVGDAISYNRSFIAKKNMKIATLPIRICRWSSKELSRSSSYK